MVVKECDDIFSLFNFVLLLSFFLSSYSLCSLLSVFCFCIIQATFFVISVKLFRFLHSLFFIFFSLSRHCSSFLWSFFVEHACLCCV